MGECMTCNDDIIELVRFSDATNTWRDYEIVKAKIYRQGESKAWDWTYLMILEDDKYPIVLTDVYASYLIENPDKAKKLARSIWLHRYR